MAYFTGTIYSETLRMDTNIAVIAPKKAIPFGREYNGKPYKVVYLLHGLSANSADWLINTEAQINATKYNVVFITAEVQRSFYTDMKYGLKYFTYISEELPKLCASLFNISAKREDTYIIGMSMGGYGALKCAMRHPETYCGVAAFSAVCDIKDNVGGNPLVDDAEFQAVFGLNYENLEQEDLFRIAKQLEGQPVQPKILHLCGTEDVLYDMNVRFRDYMQTLDLDYEYREWSGVHEWSFWQPAVKMALDYLIGMEE